MSYMKIPWTTSLRFALNMRNQIFKVQLKVLCAIIAGTIRCTVQAWMFTNVEFIRPQPRDIVYLWVYSSSQLRRQPKSKKRVRIRLLRVWTLASISSRSICPNTVTFGPASIVWGVGSDGYLSGFISWSQANSKI